MKENLAEYIGWYGTLAVLAAYFLVTYAILQPGGLLFQLLNLTGSVSLGIISLKKKNYSVVALNIVWSSVAISAIIRIII